jgi:protease II
MDPAVPFRSLRRCVTKRGNAGNPGPFKLEMRNTDQTSHLQGYRSTLYKEMLATIKKRITRRPGPMATGGTTRASTKENRTRCTGAHYPRIEHCVGWQSPPVMPNEEIVLDVNVLAAIRSTCNARSSIAVAQVAGVFDRFERRRTCQMYAQDLTSGGDCGSRPALKWTAVFAGARSNTLYLKMDAAHRPHQLMRQRSVWRRN